MIKDIIIHRRGREGFGKGQVPEFPPGRVQGGLEREEHDIVGF